MEENIINTSVSSLFFSISEWFWSGLHQTLWGSAPLSPICLHLFRKSLDIIPGLESWEKREQRRGLQAREGEVVGDKLRQVKGEDGAGIMCSLWGAKKAPQKDVSYFELTWRCWLSFVHTTTQRSSHVLRDFLSTLYIFQSCGGFGWGKMVCVWGGGRAIVILKMNYKSSGRGKEALLVFWSPDPQ